MALNETHFEFADRGSTGVYKFRFEEDPAIYVWFEYDNGTGALHTTPEAGPYRVDHALMAAEHKDLESLLAARGTTKQQWVLDLMAQRGESLAWTYP